MPRRVWMRRTMMLLGANVWNRLWSRVLSDQLVVNSMELSSQERAMCYGAAVPREVAASNGVEARRQARDVTLSTLSIGARRAVR